MKRYTLFLHDDSIAELKAIHAKTGVTPSEQIRRAIDMHLSLARAVPVSRPEDPVATLVPPRWTETK